MIPQPQLDALYDFLGSQHDSTLENINKSFQKKFNDSSILFNLGFILFQALCDNILPQKLRFVAIYIIYDQFAKSPPFPLQDLCVQSNNAFERKFINGLLAKEQYGQWTIKQLIDELDKANESKNEKCPHSRELRQVIQDPPQLLNQIDSLCQIDKFRYLNRTFLGFELDFLRPVPEKIKMECEWMECNIILDTVWDYRIELNNDQMIIIRELMQKAQLQKLTKEESQLLIDLFNKEAKYVHESGISVKIFPKLVEWNPNISGFFLARLNEIDMNIHEYLDCLHTMKITLQSLEVVNQISNSIKLPEAFVHIYVTKCIEYCEELKPQNQGRYVRIVAVFIKTLIKSKTFDPKKLYTELQGFCIEYSKISEASALFKIVKQQGEEDQKLQQQQQQQQQQ